MLLARQEKRVNQAAAISWADYYRETAGRSPRDLFTRALGFLGDTASSDLLAIDLGCGDGTEVLALLDAGWRVLAIDQEDAALALLASGVAPDAANRLQVHAARFETVTFPPADLVYAGLSLFFCPPAAFPAVWSRIRSALRPGGRFAGHFLGVRDSWALDPTVTSHTADEVKEMLAGLTVDSFAELEHDSHAVSGPKHWHLFKVVAQKP